MKIIYKQLKVNHIIVWAVVIACTLISSFAIYITYKSYDNSNKVMYVVTDKGLVTPLNRVDSKEDQMIVLQGAIGNFIDKYYTLDQYNIEDKSEKILWLASEDFVEMYKDQKAKGYYNRFTQSGIVQKGKLKLESLKISSYDEPWTVKYTVEIEVFNGGNIIKYEVDNQATLYKVNLNYPYNPFGILYTNFRQGNIREIKQ